MEQSIKMRLLKSIGTVYEQSNDCKLTMSFFETVDAELKQLSEYFKVSRNQSLIIAMVFALNYKGGTVDLKNLIEYFDCNPMKLLEFSDDFDWLHATGILKKQKSSEGLRLTRFNERYVINDRITKAILDNQPMPIIERDGVKDVIELFEKLHRLSQQRENEELLTFELYNQAEELIESHLHFPLIKKIVALHFCIKDTYLFLYLIWEAMAGNETVDISYTLERIIDFPYDRVNYLQKILSSENKLVSNDFIEIVEAGFFNDMKIKLSESSVKMLREFGVTFFRSTTKRDAVIEPSKIVSKTMFYGDSENKQLDLLQTMLQDANFKETQARLERKGYAKGITVLLHGSPGTGKTETVLQIAKATNREIIKVDISKSKSLMFGESEKIVKRIFTDYKAYAKDCERTPILLFNEADAIISKRKESGTSSVLQTENTIQNILLEELESFDGVFFATTNLVKNFDSAFDRRFLFKIEFQKPDSLIKAQIWNSKIPCLSANECENLANRFDFTGGQIDNIVRKNEIYEIIHGISVDFNNIIEFCKTEVLLQSRDIKIGFIKA